MGRIRQPTAIGFYPAGKESLEESLRDCFLDSYGPGQIPEVSPERKGNIIGGIAPHAGFVYSGPIAACLYTALAQDGLPETFVLIGPKHGYMSFEGAAIMSAGTWSTPLGECSIDTELAKIILGCGDTSEHSLIVDSAKDHQQEHSLEVQLPFLQFLSKRQPVQIVPLAISTLNFEICKKVGELVATAINESGRDVFILASTDFTHYGRRFYNYAPVGDRPIEKIVKWVYKTDGDLIQKIKQLDGEALLNTVVQERRTMCGHSAVTTVLVAARLLGATKGELLKYATSYDVRGSADAIVGYAAISINR
jgi:AmmeMemoRadiSam system protein B